MLNTILNVTLAILTFLQLAVAPGDGHLENKRPDGDPGIPGSQRRHDLSV